MQLLSNPVSALNVR